MRFRIEDHDVTCLCALIDLPKRVIVEELPPRGGRARFQVQAFVSGHVGALLEWLEPVLVGATVKRWESEFAFAMIEIDGRLKATTVRGALSSLARAQAVEIEVHTSLRDEVASWR